LDDYDGKPARTLPVNKCTLTPHEGEIVVRTIRHTRPKQITINVMDLQGPPSECTQTEKLRDLKTLAQQYARDQGSCDDTRISYLEFLESEAEDDLTLARMISG
jgi:hypothetical protein